MKKNNFVVGFALMILLIAPSLRAQIISAGDLFGPGAPPPMIGVELGFGQHTQNGTFQAACKCTFENCTGSGFLGGLLFELPVSYEWTIGLGVKLDLKSLTCVTNVLDTATITYSPGDSASSGSFKFERDGDIKETFLTIAPFVRYEFFRNGPFLQAGPGIGFLVSSKFTHTRVLNSSTITLDNGQTITNVRFQNGTRTETLEDGKIANAVTTRISALLTAGWDIAIGDHSVIAPMITYDLPFTNVRPDFVGADGAANWKITSLYISVGLKYRLD